MVNRNPEMEYGETPDMTVYQRKEGDKIAIYVQKDWPDEIIIYNVLSQRHRNKYIDYLVIYDPNGFTQRVCKEIGISYIDYEENEFSLFLDNIMNFVFNKGLLFYKVETTHTKRFMDAMEYHDIPLSVLR